jgi:hypothetical protein
MFGHAHPPFRSVDPPSAPLQLEAEQQRLSELEAYHRQRGSVQVRPGVAALAVSSQASSPLLWNLRESSW